MYKEDNYNGKEDAYDKKKGEYLRIGIDHTPAKPWNFGKEFYKSEKPRQEVVVKVSPAAKDADEEFSALKLFDTDVTGSLFDRVLFLQKRIDEIRNNTDVRMHIHEEIMKEIDSDIKDKEFILSGLTEMHDKRNFKMDISLLRKEKRHEDVQFWKDIVELQTALQELMEQFETESKIAAIFRSIGETDVHA